MTDRLPHLLALRWQRKFPFLDPFYILPTISDKSFDFSYAWNANLLIAHIRYQRLDL